MSESGVCMGYGMHFYMCVHYQLRQIQVWARVSLGEGHCLASPMAQECIMQRACVPALLSVKKR